MSDQQLAEPAAPEVPVVTALTAQDRCDRCGAQAHVRYELKAGELLFCAHHTREHEDALTERGARKVLDSREMLNGR